MAELELPADVRPLSLPGVFTAQYEIDTLPLLFAPDATFTEYYDALARKNTHITTQVEDLREKNRVARALRAGGMWQDCVDMLWECLELRKDLFDAKDFQLTAAQRHYVMTLLNFATFFLREGGNGRTSGEEAMFFRSFGLFKKAEEAVTIIDDRVDRMLLKAMIENNYAAYYSRRRKQKAASQRMASAVKAFKVYSDSTNGATKLKGGDSDDSDAEDAGHAANMSDAEFKTRTEALYFAFQAGTSDIFCGRFESGLKRLMASVKEAETLQMAVDAPPSNQDRITQNKTDRDVAAPRAIANDESKSINASPQSATQVSPQSAVPDSPSKSRASSSRRSSRRSSRSNSSASQRYSSDPYSSQASTPRTAQSQPSPQKSTHSSPKKSKHTEESATTPIAPSRPAASPPKRQHRPGSASHSHSIDQPPRSAAVAPPEGGFAIQIIGSSAPTDVLATIGLYHNIAVALVGLRRHTEGAKWEQRALDVALANAENGVSAKGNIVSIILRSKDFCEKMSFRHRPTGSQTASSAAKAKSSSVGATSKRPSINKPARGSSADPNQRLHQDEDRKSYAVVEEAFAHPRSAEAARAYLPHHAGRRFKEASAVEKLQTYLKGLSYRQLVEDYQIEDNGKYRKLKAKQESLKRDPATAKAEERERVRQRQEATLQRHTELVGAQQSRVVTPRNPSAGKELTKREVTPKTSPTPSPRAQPSAVKSPTKEASKESATAEATPSPTTGILKSPNTSPSPPRTPAPAPTPLHATDSTETPIPATQTETLEKPKPQTENKAPKPDPAEPTSPTTTQSDPVVVNGNQNDSTLGEEFEKNSEVSSPLAIHESSKDNQGEEILSARTDVSNVTPRTENRKKSASEAASQILESASKKAQTESEPEKSPTSTQLTPNTIAKQQKDDEFEAELTKASHKKAEAVQASPINPPSPSEKVAPAANSEHSFDEFEDESPKVTPRNMEKDSNNEKVDKLITNTSPPKDPKDSTYGEFEADSPKASPKQPDPKDKTYGEFEDESPKASPKQADPKDEYGDDDFDNPSESSSPQAPSKQSTEVKPDKAPSPNEADEYNDEFESDAQTPPKKKETIKDSSPQSPSYDDDDFEEEL